MIYVVKTHKTNVSNLFLALFLENNKDQLYEPCSYSIASDGLLVLSMGRLIMQLCNDPDRKFRYIDWSSSIDQLKKLYHSTDKHLIFGAHNVDQINYLKQQFGKEITTIAINYTRISYPLLIKNMAKYHVYMLTNRLIESTEKDQELLDYKSKDELVLHYETEFDQLSLIPSESLNQLDYEIDIADFFSKQKMLPHINNLGFDITDGGNTYYDTWLSSWKT